MAGKPRRSNSKDVSSKQRSRGFSFWNACFRCRSPQRRFKIKEKNFSPVMKTSQIGLDVNYSELCHLKTKLNSVDWIKMLSLQTENYNDLSCNEGNYEIDKLINKHLLDRLEQTDTEYYVTGAHIEADDDYLRTMMKWADQMVEEEALINLKSNNFFSTEAPDLSKFQPIGYPMPDLTTSFLSAFDKLPFEKIWSCITEMDTFRENTLREEIGMFLVRLNMARTMLFVLQSPIQDFLGIKRSSGTTTSIKTLGSHGSQRSIDIKDGLKKSLDEKSAHVLKDDKFGEMVKKKSISSLSSITTKGWLHWKRPITDILRKDLTHEAKEKSKSSDNEQKTRNSKDVEARNEMPALPVETQPEATGEHQTSENQQEQQPEDQFQLQTSEKETPAEYLAETDDLLKDKNEDYREKNLEVEDHVPPRFAQSVSEGELKVTARQKWSKLDRLLARINHKSIEILRIALISWLRCESKLFTEEFDNQGEDNGVVKKPFDTMAIQLIQNKVELLIVDLVERNALKEQSKREISALSNKIWTSLREKVLSYSKVEESYIARAYFGNREHWHIATILISRYYYIGLLMVVHCILVGFYVDHSAKKHAALYRTLENFKIRAMVDVDFGVLRLFYINHLNTLTSIEGVNVQIPSLQKSLTSPVVSRNRIPITCSLITLIKERFIIGAHAQSPLFDLLTQEMITFLTTESLANESLIMDKGQSNKMSSLRKLLGKDILSLYIDLLPKYEILQRIVTLGSWMNRDIGFHRTLNKHR